MNFFSCILQVKEVFGGIGQYTFIFIFYSKKNKIQNVIDVLFYLMYLHFVTKKLANLKIIF